MNALDNAYRTDALRGFDPDFPFTRTLETENVDIEDVKLSEFFNEIRLTIPAHWGFSEAEEDALCKALTPLNDNFCIDVADTASYSIMDYVPSGRFSHSQNEQAFQWLCDDARKIIMDAVIKHALSQPLD